MSYAPRTRMLVNLVLSQAGWFACVLGAAHGRPWIGLCTTAAVLTWHLLTEARPAAEAVLIAVTVAVGVVWDSTVMNLGIISFAHTAPALLSPPVMWALWALFATTLNVSISWLKYRPVLAAVLGFIAGPAAYYAGMRAGALTFTPLVTGLIVTGIGWGTIMPGLFALARALDKTTFQLHSRGAHG